MNAEPAAISGSSDGRGDHRSLVRYRVLAYTTAVLLIVLVFAGIPLQVWAGKPQIVHVVGTAHGFLYIVYLFTAFDLTRRLRVPLGRMVLVLLAGTVPFCAIVAERKLSKLYQHREGDASRPELDAAVQEG